MRESDDLLTSLMSFCPNCGLRLLRIAYPAACECGWKEEEFEDEVSAGEGEQPR